MEQTGRCSGPGEIAAAALGKGVFSTFRSPETKKDVGPTPVPKTLVHWIRDPVPDMMLGTRVLAEMSKHTQVLYSD